MTATRPAAQWALAALAALTMQACATEPAGPLGTPDGARARGAAAAYDGRAEELRANRERWEGAGVEDYRYVIRQVCACDPESYLVEVRRGEAASVTPLGGERERLTWRVDSLDNFRELFDRVQAEMESRPDGLKAAYDPEWGYPVYLYVDPRRDVAEDERGFSVERFEPTR
jgi:hypothetical protein